MFAKLLVIYGNKYNEIVEFYEQFIPNFAEVEEIVEPMRKKTIEVMAPEVFVKKYSRNCVKDKIPTIITDEQAQEETRPVMRFPREAQENEPHYPSDGRNPHYYICTNPEYPYPGLQHNKLDNKVDYPFVPCCFKTKQEGKKGGLYDMYFSNKKEETKEKKQQELIITNKFLDPDKYGNLPVNLQKFFQVLDTEVKYKYIRVGVSKGLHSFLKAVMVGMYDQTGILDSKTDKEREEKVLEIRNELASANISAMARQSMYDFSDKKVREHLRDSKAYFDPKFYLQLLEGYFNCNIFLFRRKKDEDDVIPTLPRYIQSYYKDKRDSPCVFVYEHWGSESDHATYPRCELIVRWNTKKSDDTQYSFPYDSKISKNMNKVFRLLNESYSLNKKIPEVVFPVESPKDTTLVSQCIDSYGKTRRIDIKYKGKMVSLLTSPIPPLALEEKDIAEVYLTTADTALKIFAALGAKIESQTASKRILKEINGILGNVSVTIPVQDQSLLELPISNFGIHYPGARQGAYREGVQGAREGASREGMQGSDVSAIEIYNKNKKMARYITEYVFWLFSKYIQDANIPEVTDKVLASFAKKMIKIIPDFQYKIVPKTFSMNSNVIDGGKLVVSSEDMLKRLMYVLKMYSIRDMKTLRNYHSKNVITHYYVDITDFDNFPGQVILQGEDAIDKWIQESKFVYTIRNSIVIGQNSPYFFKNDLVEDELFLAQNANSLEKALSIALAWQKQGYNPGLEADNIINKSYDFTLYSYTNPEDIVKYKVESKHGKKLEKEIRILGYRLSGVEFYTVLLSL
jgi:hypothetical protein